jgi:hypothetical protein
MLDEAARAGWVTAMGLILRGLRLGGQPRPVVTPGPVRLEDLAPGELRAVL